MELDDESQFWSSNVRQRISTTHGIAVSVQVQFLRFRSDLAPPLIPSIAWPNCCRLTGRPPEPDRHKSAILVASAVLPSHDHAQIEDQPCPRTSNRDGSRGGRLWIRRARHGVVLLSR